MILNGQITALRVGGPGLPQTLLAGFGSDAPAELWAAGPIALLDLPKTAFFCSSQCPGSVVLKTFDAITRMRDEGKVFIGGFHSVMEWECLGILLRGHQPVIWVPARSIVGMHLKPELVPAFKAGRLLILSPFQAHHRNPGRSAQQLRRRTCRPHFRPPRGIGKQDPGSCSAARTQREADTHYKRLTKCPAVRYGGRVD